MSRLRSKIRNTRHHFRSANWKQLRNYEQVRSGSDKLPLWRLFANSWRYGADFEDNYVLDFFNKSPQEIRTYITRSLFFEFCEQVNQFDKTHLTRDKLQFSLYFHDALGRKVWSWDDLQNLTDNQPTPSRLVVKNRWGRRGEEVYFLEPGISSWSKLRQVLESQFSPPAHYVYEEHLEQHPDLNKLNPGSLNTVRVYTFLRTNQEVEIWPMFLKVGSGRGVDTISQGGFGFKLDERGMTGEPCFTKNPFFKVPFIHPLTQEPLLGFQLPYFEELKRLACKSARLLPEIRAVGWDIAITPQGPCLIEGNDRGDHMFFQKVMEQGCKYLLIPHCELKVY